MAIKQTAHIIRGLRRDFSDSKQPKEYAIDAKNIRITNREDSSLLSITNEKGTQEIPLGSFDLRTLLGYSVLNNYIILFVRIFKRSLLDAIITYDVESSSWNILYSGNLGFSTENPIEALSVYENKDIQKVYWVDGVNQPRVINIAAKQEEIDSWTDKSFDFIQELQLNETIKVEKSYSSGSFNSGVIQYAFNYYNKNGQESNIVEVTPINYISYEDRGAAPNDYVSNSFKITISNYDKNFDYLRLYSIHRTSLDAIPSVKIVADINLKIAENKVNVTYLDTGIIGETIDPVELLYKGGEYIIPKTLAQKDGTLFFGNIKLNNKTSLSENAINKLQESTINWQALKGQPPVSLTGYYPYKSNLKYPSISGFQSRETYRLGIQFQDKTGKWTDPIFHSDSTVSSVPRCSSDGNTIYYFSNSAKLALSTELLEEAKLNNYIKVRGVVVYPQDEERKVVAQGILCPTVFNASSRYKGVLDVQPSWYLRPYTKIDESADNKEQILYGSYPEFRHGIALPPNWKRNCEIQSMVYSDNTSLYLDNYYSPYKNADFYGIDKSILTFHSPEIELKKITNIEGIKIRIVGYTELTSSIGDINITTSNGPAADMSTPFINYFKGISNINSPYNASRSILSGLLWTDAMVSWDWNSGFATSATEDDNNDILGKTMHMVYPWHRTGSLNNGPKDTALLKSKKISNLKYFAYTSYIDSVELNAFDIKLFDSNNSNSTIRLNVPRGTDSTGKDYYLYKGEIDTVISYFSEDLEYSYTKNKDFIDSDVTLNHNNGYPMIVGYPFDDGTKELPFKDKVQSPIFPIDSIAGITESVKNNLTLYGKEPIEIKYKTPSHAVISLGINNIGGKILLPIAQNFDSEKYFDAPFKDLSGRYFNNIIQTHIPIDINNSYLWLAELYREEVPNKFGGTDYKNNIWYPAGDSVYLFNEDGSLKSDISVEFTQGDTFFARFDSLKTYSDDLDAVNSVTEIGSFMVETRINLDARYDRNRGQQSNLVMNPGNFNLFNDVYNQKNNFFNYRIIDKDIADNTKFPNTIVWSKQKFAGADVDAWTNINMASSLDLDGTKGELTKLVSFKNEIFSFQPEAINHILFNSRVQIPTSDGVPIELTNAYKVGGARQLSSVGSSNPLAIKSTDRGIYYMDNITKGIYVFNGQQSDSLSDKLGMSSWVKQQDIDSYRIDYDKINQDVYFINHASCLGYSEKLGEFESFFDYNNSKIFNIKDGTYAIKSNRLYKLFEGNYNRFFEYGSKPFWVTFTHNENPFNDKIYNTLEFRADTYNYITKDEEGNNITTPYWELSNNSSFNTIKVKNEYQDTEEVSLEFNRFTPSNLKRKFRIWRANIPRDFINKRDRIRNTWANITLKASNPSNTKTELHDLVVSYFM